MSYIHIEWNIKNTVKLWNSTITISNKHWVPSTNLKPMHDKTLILKIRRHERRTEVVCMTVWLGILGFFQNQNHLDFSWWNTKNPLGSEVITQHWVSPLAASGLNLVTESAFLSPLPPPALELGFFFLFFPGFTAVAKSF